MRYTDEASGAVHIFGFGHMVMKTAPASGQRDAVIDGTDVAGLGFAIGGDQQGLIVGWGSTRKVTILAPDTGVSLRWPSSSFLELELDDPLGTAEEPIK